MASNFKYLLIFGAGFAGGWVARSLADSPQGVGVKLLEIAMNTKERVSRWAAVEREHLDDMFAEARSRVESNVPEKVPAKNGSSTNVRAMNGVA